MKAPHSPAAALGVLLVLIQAGNQIRNHWLSDKLDTEIKAADVVDRAVLEAEVALRRVSIQFRSIRGVSSIAPSALYAYAFLRRLPFASMKPMLPGALPASA